MATGSPHSPEGAAVLVGVARVTAALEHLLLALMAPAPIAATDWSCRSASLADPAHSARLAEVVAEACINALWAPLKEVPRGGPLRRRDAGTLARFAAFFPHPDLEWVEHDLRAPDALQAASCLQFKGGAIMVAGIAPFQRVPSLRLALVNGGEDHD
ncbi:MAG: hypothetical protein VKO26_00665 [Cyanobacteriota bacterium]|nr:hypothetical protein [Cyanobacteriota bacterium]